MTQENNPILRKKINYLLLLRRLHLYSGILLCPFITIMGISGFLFNHDSSFWGGPNEAIPMTSTENLKKNLSFDGISPVEMAKKIVADLNRNGNKFELIREDRSYFNRPLVFESNDLKVELNLETVEVEAYKTTQPKYQPTKAPFQDITLSFPPINLQEMSLSFNEIFKEENSHFKPRSALNCELIFTVKDKNGTHWNGRYNIAKNQLIGEKDVESSPLNLYSFLTRLHKTHHYPHEINHKWLWIFMADITALTLVFWGVSGLIMAWQIRSQRKICTILLIPSLVLISWLVIANFYTLKETSIRTRESTPTKYDKPKT